MKPTWLKWRLVLSLAVLLIALGMPWMVADFIVPRLLVVPDRASVDHRDTPARYGIPFQNFDVTTVEGFVLKGWFAPGQKTKAKGTVVILHGKSSCKEHMLILVRLLAPAEYNVIVYDSRAQGESAGKYCTYGSKEKADLFRYLDEAEKRFGALGPVGVVGTSFGAAVAVAALAADERRFCCGIVCSPFCDLEEAARRQLENTAHFDWSWALKRGLRRGEEWAEFRVTEICPERMAERVTCPVLVMHGEKDERFPVEWGRRMYARFPSAQKEWYLARGNGHDDMFWFHDAVNVKQKMLEFLGRWMQGEMPAAESQTHS